MKKIKYFILFTILLFVLTNCNTNDDGFYNTVYLHNAKNLVAIKTEDQYNVGDYLYVSADFSRYQIEADQTELLDIYRTTGGADSFDFSYVLERKIGNEWKAVIISTDKLDIKKGNAASGTFVYGYCKYNPVNTMYEYNVGFPLLESGQYRLNFGYNSDSNEVELISNSKKLNLKMTIFTTINNNLNSIYYFTVN